MKLPNSIDAVRVSPHPTRYRNAATFYFGDAGYGDLARSSVGLGGVFRANAIPVDVLMYADEWGVSALSYVATVPAFYVSNNILKAADAIGIIHAVRVLSQ